MTRKSRANRESTIRHGGNTDITVPVKKQELQSKHWCFTLNNYTVEQIEKVDQYLNWECNKWIYGFEVGENGTPHLQGYMILNTKKRMTQIKNETGLNGIHLEITRNKRTSPSYCAKDGNYVQEGFLLHELRPQEKWVYDKVQEDIPKFEDFYEWQKDAYEMLQENSHRNVYWIYDLTGHIGKSSFSKYMMLNLDCLLVNKGKYADIMNMAWMKGKHLRRCIIDIPRDNGNMVSYLAIESIKNGVIINTKYETGQRCIPPVNVMILANAYPVTSALSEDRWNIYEIIDKKLVRREVGYDLLKSDKKDDLEYGRLTEN